MTDRNFGATVAQILINLDDNMAIEPKSPLHRDLWRTWPEGLAVLGGAKPERDRLREINAELLEALKATSRALRQATIKGRSIAACKALDTSDAAIAKAEGSDE